MSSSVGKLIGSRPVVKNPHSHRLTPKLQSNQWAQVREWKSETTRLRIFEEASKGNSSIPGRRVYSPWFGIHGESGVPDW